jgi:pyruvate dehydrogenase E2 component (dihydrolipoamide acetyltransferase)
MREEAVSKQFEAVTIPKWGIEMTHGRLVEWRFSEGQTVNAGDELVDIETDKIVNSFEARVSGTLATILVPEGEELPVGTLIGVIALGEYREDELAQYIASQSGCSSLEGRNGNQHDSDAKVDSSESIGLPSSIKIAPALRRKLESAGVDPTTIIGSGPGGRIVKEDVDRAVMVASTSLSDEHAVADRVQPIGRGLSASQKRVAESLSRAQATIPIYFLRRRVSMRQAVTYVSDTSIEGGATLTAVMVKAVARALSEHQSLNIQFDGDVVTPIDKANVGVAVARYDGAVSAPVTAGADCLDFCAMVDQLRAQIERARAGRLTDSDMAAAAITLSNLGMFGVDDFTAMVTPPQVMALSVGQITQQPLWDETSAAFMPEPMLTLTLSADHRVINGAEGAQFLSTVATVLEAMSSADQW